MRVKILLYDEKTGEVLETLDKPAFRSHHKLFLDKHYVKVFNSFLLEVVKNERLGNGPWRLLLYAIHKLNFNNLEVHLIPQKVMKELEITERTYYRWLKTLIEEGYLEKLGSKNLYRLKPYSAVKGQMRKIKDLGFFEREP